MTQKNYGNRLTLIILSKFDKKKTWNIFLSVGSKVTLGLCQVNQRSNYLGGPYGHQIWSEEPLTRMKRNAWVKGHKGVMQGEPEVKLFAK